MRSWRCCYTDMNLLALHLELSVFPWLELLIDEGYNHWVVSLPGAKCPKRQCKLAVNYKSDLRCGCRLARLVQVLPGATGEVQQGCPHGVDKQMNAAKRRQVVKYRGNCREFGRECASAELAGCSPCDSLNSVEYLPFGINFWCVLMSMSNSLHLNLGSDLIDLNVGTISLHLSLSSSSNSEKSVT